MKKGKHPLRQTKVLPSGVAGEDNEARERGISAWRELKNRRPEIAEHQTLAASGIRSNSQARKAFDSLIKQGLRSPELFEYLVGHAVKLPRRGKSSNFHPDVRATDKELENFPKRLRAIAEDIEKRNIFPLMPDVNSIQYLNLSKPARMVFAVDLPKLPGTICIFAKIFEIHFRTTRRGVWNSNRFAPQAQALSQLIDLLREETGGPRFEMLARILTAVAEVAKTNQIFHAESLKQLDTRLRKRRKNISAMSSSRKKNLIRLLARTR